MKVLILGSGLLGVTSAYQLARRGMEVTVLDRQPESGRECSFANGGQMSYSHAEPWASPHILPKMPKWLLDPESPLVFRLRADPQMMRWALMFLRNCTAHRARVNCVNLLRLGLYSKRKLEELRNDTGIDFDFSSRSILHFFSSEADWDHAKRQNAFQMKFGCEQHVLSREECFAMEPALQYTPRAIVGGMHAVTDECGDAYRFCNELAKLTAERYGTAFEYGVTVNGLKTEGGRIVAVETDKGSIAADTYVMALGCYSQQHLRRIGVRIPVYPMKGYSITLAANEHAPQHSISDGSYKIVYTRLGDRMRVAGTAEFAGYNDSLNEKRLAPIIRATKEMFPRMDWGQEIGKWACLRPSTPDGPPILGRTPYANLFLNTGHGTLGWTQAAGSAAIVADAIEGKQPEILTQGLTIDRYQ